MSQSRLRRWILKVYPAAFRDRYGEELSQVAADCGNGWRVTFDLAVAATEARLNPDFVVSRPEGRRARLLATTSTVFALWAWSVVAVGIFARAVDDQPVPGLTSWGWSAYATGTAVFELSAAVILVLGFGYWLRVVIPALRRRERETTVAAVLPVGVVVAWLAGTGLVAIASHHIRSGNYRHISAQGPHTAGGWALLVGYAVFTVAGVAVCTVSVRRALRQAELPERLLSVSSLVAAGASAALVAVATCATVCLVRVLMIGGISARDGLTATAPVGFLLFAAVAASLSSVRGVTAIRAGRGESRA